MFRPDKLRINKVMETIVEEHPDTEFPGQELEFKKDDIACDSIVNEHNNQIYDDLDDVTYDSDFDDLYNDIYGDINENDPNDIDYRRVNSLIYDIAHKAHLLIDPTETPDRGDVAGIFHRWIHILLDDFRYYNSQPIVTAFVKCFYPSIPDQEVVDVFVDHGYVLTNGIVGDAAQDLGTILDVVIDLCRFEEADGNPGSDKFRFVFDIAREYSNFVNHDVFVEKMVIGHMLFVSILNACDNELYKNILDLLWTNDADLVGFQISAVWWDEIILSRDIYSQLKGDWKTDYVGEGMVGIVIAMWNQMNVPECLTYVECLDKLISYRKWVVLDKRKNIYAIDEHDKDIEYYSSHAIRTEMDTFLPLRIITNLLEYNGQYVKMHVISSKIQMALRFFGFGYYYDSVSRLGEYVFDMVSLHEYYLRQSHKPYTGETMYERVKFRTRASFAHRLRFCTQSTDSDIQIDYGVSQPIIRQFTQENTVMRYDGLTPERIVYADCVVDLRSPADPLPLSSYKLNIVTKYDCDVFSSYSSEHAISDVVSVDGYQHLDTHSIPIDRIYAVPFSDVFFPIVKESLIPHKYLGVICLDDKLNAILINILLSFSVETASPSWETRFENYYYQDGHDSFTFSNYNTHFGRYVLYDKVNKYYSGTGHCLLPTPMPLLNSQNVKTSARNIKLMSGAQFHMVDSCASFFNHDSKEVHIQPVCRSCGNIGTSQYIVRVCETLHSYKYSHFEANLRYFDKYKEDYYKYESYKTNKHPALRSLRTNSNKLLRADYDDNHDYQYVTRTTRKNSKSKKDVYDSQYNLMNRIHESERRIQLEFLMERTSTRASNGQRESKLPSSFLSMLADDSQIIPGLFKAPFAQSRLYGDDILTKPTST